MENNNYKDYREIPERLKILVHIATLPTILRLFNLILKLITESPIIHP